MMDNQMESNSHAEATGLTMASYGMGKFLAEFLTGAYGLMVYYFFETEMRLSGFYVSIATVIYSLWNAVNDPMIGYTTSRRRTKGYWVVLGLILCSLAYSAIFSVPSSVAGSQIGLLLWMVVFVCAYDFCYSLWEVNHQGIFPDKFRTTKEREKCAIFCTVIGVFGIALGAVLPPMFYSYGHPETFRHSAVIVGAVGLAGAVLIIRGVKETREMKESRKRRTMNLNSAISREERNSDGNPSAEKTSPKNPGFAASLKGSLKHREFLAFVLLMFFYQSACICMTSSVNYVAHGYLGFEKGSATTPIFAAMLVGALLSVIIWKIVAARIKNNNQKMLCITGIFMALSSLAMVFCETQMQFAGGMFIWGLGFGGFWTFMVPGMADVVDSVVVKEEIRNDGILMGVRAFFCRLSYASQAIVFWLCHKATGYDNTVRGIQSGAARFGIKLHFCIVPCAFFILSVIVFKSLNTLTPEKVEYNKKRLRELEL